MTAIEIVNPVPVGEIAPWLASMATTFLSDPDEIVEDTATRATSWEPGRAWGARSGERWVATLRTEARRITVPGTDAELAVDALTNVTVAATHRRRGLLRAMITESLSAAKDRGDPVSVLIAAEWPIYGRFGYAPASECADYVVRTRDLGSQLIVDGTGDFRQVDGDEIGAIAPALFDAGRSRRAGNIDRPSYWWDRELGRNGARRSDKRSVVHVVHEAADGPDGYVSWLSTGNWTLTGNLGEIAVRDLVAANDAAYVSLWLYLFGIDVVDQVHLHMRPIDERLHWLLADGRVMRQTHRLDWMWLRILDVASALSMRRYGCDGSIVIEIVDPDGPTGYAAGRYLLESGPDGAQCRPTTRTADLVIHQRALAAAYLGGTSLRSQSVAGLITEGTPGSLRLADAMFATPLAPWCATSF
jgi:predicted acetyltransferase